MTDVHNTTDLKTTPIPEQQLAGPGCAHLTGLPVLSPMSDEQLEEAWTTGLRTHGRRVTKQRLAVLHAVQDHPHSTADTIVQAVRERIPAITVQSVYVILAVRTARNPRPVRNPYRRQPPPRLLRALRQG